MKIKGTAVIISLLVVAIAGGIWYMKEMRKRADIEAKHELSGYFQLLSAGVDSEVQRKEMRACLDRLMDLSERCNEKMSAELRCRCMDGEYLLGNYDTAVKLIDQLPGKSKEWKALVISKLRAHAALVKNDIPSAIEQFKIFIGLIEADPAFVTQDDPATDVEWTKAAVLANNYRRIYTLSKQIGDEVKAAEYLGKAKSLAKQAIEESEDNREDYLKEFADILNGWKPE